MLRHIFTAAALPIPAEASTSRRMPNGVIASAKTCAASPPSNIGTRCPYGRTGAMTAASTNRAPLASITCAICRFKAGETELRSA